MSEFGSKPSEKEWTLVGVHHETREGPYSVVVTPEVVDGGSQLEPGERVRVAPVSLAEELRKALHDAWQAHTAVVLNREDDQARYARVQDILHDALVRAGVSGSSGRPEKETG